MALSNPRIFFGIHSFTPYSRTTKLPYGTVLALGASSFSLEGELVSLNAGSSKYPWAVEESTISAELSLTLKEYPDFLFELFLGKAPTSNVAEASGSVTTLTDVYGGSVMNSSTGIASVGLKSGASASVKFGYYVIKAVSATTVDVYAMSNVDAARGTDFSFENDALKITASPLTVTASTATEIPGTGIEFTGGSGSIGLTSGHTAYFQTRPINSVSMDVTVGATTDVFPEFGAICVAKQRGNGEMVELDIFRLKAVGLPMNFAEGEYSEAEVTAQAYYDSSQSGVFKVRHVTPA